MLALTQAWILRPQKRRYDLEVKVTSNTSEQKDTSDDDDLEDVHAIEELASSI